MAENIDVPESMRQKALEVKPFESGEQFTPMVREIMLAQPLNTIVPLGFSVCNSTNAASNLLNPCLG